MYNPMRNNSLKSNNLTPNFSKDEFLEEEKSYSHSKIQEFSNKDMGASQIPQEEMTEEEKFFKDFNDQQIDEKDPSLGKNLIKIYEEEVPFELRYEDEEKSVFQPLLCKILTTDEMQEQINIKVEIASYKDLFFYYTSDVNLQLFEKIKEEQKLTCTYNNFSDLLIKYFDYCINDQKSYLAVLNVHKDKKVSMELLENLEYKFVQLVKMNFELAPEELINEQIKYRYNSMRAMEDIMKNRIDVVNGVLKDLDPPLILEVKREILGLKLDNNSSLNVKLK